MDDNTYHYILNSPHHWELPLLCRREALLKLRRKVTRIKMVYSVFHCVTLLLMFLCSCNTVTYIHNEQVNCASWTLFKSIIPYASALCHVVDTPINYCSGNDFAGLLCTGGVTIYFHTVVDFLLSLVIFQTITSTEFVHCHV